VNLAFAGQLQEKDVLTVRDRVADLAGVPAQDVRLDVTTKPTVVFVRMLIPVQRNGDSQSAAAATNMAASLNTIIGTRDSVRRLVGFMLVSPPLITMSESRIITGAPPPMGVLDNLTPAETNIIVVASLLAVALLLLLVVVIVRERQGKAIFVPLMSDSGLAVTSEAGGKMIRREHVVTPGSMAQMADSMELSTTRA